MPIVFREYLDNTPIYVKTKKNTINLNEAYNEDSDPISPDSIMQDIEGIHVGPTRNFTRYREEALDSSIPSWTKPYQKPLIMHHNEKDGKTIGRVVSVVKKTVNTRSGTPALVFTCNVPDPEGIKGIKDGRLKTVSVGVIAHDARCSICGKPIELDENGVNISCQHIRGEEYDGETCYWDIYDMEAKELSYVIVPSDIYAHNLRTYSPNVKKLNSINENLNLNEGMDINMSNQKKSKEEDEKKNEDPIVNPKDDTEKDVQTQTDDESEKANGGTKGTDDKDKEIEDLKAEKIKLEKDLASAKETIKELKIKVADAVLEKDNAAKELNTEKELRQAADSKNVSLQKDLKESAIERLNLVRQSLGKGIVAKESLEKRTLDSIKDSLIDLTEEFNASFKVKNIQEAADPTLSNPSGVDTNKKTDINVKESKTLSNKELNREFHNFLNDIF